MSSSGKLSLDYTLVNQSGKKLLLTAMPAYALVKISYSAVRRQDDEEGAVQRPLSERRISSIRDFALEGGDFPACIILNWVKGERLSVGKEKITITLADWTAQIIDGQHRVAGIGEAIITRTALKNMQLPVAIYQQLTTQQCADIFLSINTEQKPVQKSLAYDLFGIASSHVVDPAAVRAADIAHVLNTDEDSPYCGLVKYSGENQTGRGKRRLGLALSTIVTALKPLVAEKGVFESVGVTELNKQIKVLTTFFTVLENWYGDDWISRENAFMHAAGFNGAIDFLKTKLVPYCNVSRSFTYATISSAMNLKPSNVIKRQELSKMQGSASARKVTDLLIEKFEPNTEQEEELEF